MVLKLLANSFDLASKLGLTHLNISRLALNWRYLSLSGPSCHLLIHRISGCSHFLLRLRYIILAEVVSNYRVAVIDLLTVETGLRRHAGQMVWNNQYFFVLDVGHMSLIFALGCDRPSHVRFQ